MSLISALVVMYNPGNDMIQCLDSLMTIKQQMPLEIIVVDNASSNQLAKTLPEQFPQIKFIRSDDNLGFGGGNNLAFSHSTGDYVICVNPDLVLTQSALNHLVTILESSEQIGLVGPKTLNPDGSLAYTARADYTVLRLCAKYLGVSRFVEGWFYKGYPRKMEQANEPFAVDWVQGSCMLLRRATFEALEGFDDEFFLYLEDTDLCQRVRQLGVQVLYVPQAIVTHVGGSTTARFPYIRVKSYHHSPIHYHRKQGHPLGVWLLKLVFSLELSLKSLFRMSRYRLNSDEHLQEHYRAELKVLRQLWGW